ncbi:hypothetical protein BKA70DRAFT_1342274, partial [Coprinopsis sp. MPI-PUGE-AT-0042]
MPKPNTQHQQYIPGQPKHNVGAPTRIPRNKNGSNSPAGNASIATPTPIGRTSSFFLWHWSKVHVHTRERNGSLSIVAGNGRPAGVAKPTTDVNLRRSISLSRLEVATFLEREPQSNSGLPLSLELSTITRQTARESLSRHPASSVTSREANTTFEIDPETDASLQLSPSNLTSEVLAAINASDSPSVARDWSRAGQAVIIDADAADSQPISPGVDGEQSFTRNLPSGERSFMGERTSDDTSKNTANFIPSSASPAVFISLAQGKSSQHKPTSRRFPTPSPTVQVSEWYTVSYFTPTAVSSLSVATGAKMMGKSSSSGTNFSSDVNDTFASGSSKPPPSNLTSIGKGRPPRKNLQAVLLGRESSSEEVVVYPHTEATPYQQVPRIALSSPPSPTRGTSRTDSNARAPVFTPAGRASLDSRRAPSRPYETPRRPSLDLSSTPASGLRRSSFELRRRAPGSLSRSTTSNTVNTLSRSATSNVNPASPTGTASTRRGQGTRSQLSPTSTDRRSPAFPPPKGNSPTTSSMSYAEGSNYAQEWVGRAPGRVLRAAGLIDGTSRSNLGSGRPYGRWRRRRNALRSPPTIYSSQRQEYRSRSGSGSMGPPPLAPSPLAPSPLTGGRYGSVRAASEYNPSGSGRAQSRMAFSEAAGPSTTTSRRTSGIFPRADRDRDATVRRERDRDGSIGREREWDAKTEDMGSKGSYVPTDSPTFTATSSGGRDSRDGLFYTNTTPRSGASTVTAATSISGYLGRDRERLGDRDTVSGRESLMAQRERERDLKERHAGEMAALLSALSDSQATARLLREENSELRERLRSEELRGDNEDLRLDVEDLKGENEELRRIVGELRHECLERRRGQDELRNQVDGLSLRKSTESRQSLGSSLNANPGRQSGFGSSTSSGASAFWNSSTSKAGGSAPFRFGREISDSNRSSSLSTGYHHGRRPSTSSSIFPLPPSNMSMLVNEDAHGWDGQSWIASNRSSAHGASVRSKESHTHRRPGSIARNVARERDLRRDAHNISPATANFSMMSGMTGGRGSPTGSYGGRRSPDGSLFLKPEHELFLDEMESMDVEMGAKVEAMKQMKVGPFGFVPAGERDAFN